MKHTLSDALLRAAFDTLPERAAVIDATGQILGVNRAWRRAAGSGQWPLYGESDGNYFQMGERAAAGGDACAAPLVEQLRQAVDTRRRFRCDYNCTLDGAQRWFVLSVVPLVLPSDAPAANPHFLLLQQDVTRERRETDRERSRALTDALTGVANRRRFDEFLDVEWRRAVRGQSPLALLLVDVDHFKKLNDRYGHHVGDDCLIRIARVLSRYGQRPGDLIARYGGDEFAMIAANTAEDGARTIATEVLTAVRHLGIRQAAVGASPLTVSIGVAVAVPSHEPEGSRLFQQADRMLYAAKRAGRDRVCLHGREAQRSETLA